MPMTAKARRRGMYGYKPQIIFDDGSYIVLNNFTFSGRSTAIKVALEAIDTYTEAELKQKFAHKKTPHDQE